MYYECTIIQAQENMGVSFTIKKNNINVCNVCKELVSYYEIICTKTHNEKVKYISAK